MRELRRSAALLLLAALCLSALPLRLTQEREDAKAQPLAVIVNAKNPTTNLTLRQLRSYFKLGEEYWPDRKKFVLYLRSPGSNEQAVLLEEVYKMSKSELQKYWVGKINRGEVTKSPAAISTARKAGAQVKKVDGAISVVFASEVPEGVRVLTIDGKKPGEEGYPLVSPAEGSASL